MSLMDRLADAGPGQDEFVPAWPVRLSVCVHAGDVAGHPLGRLPTSRPISGPIADPVSAGFDVVPREVNERCLDLCF